MLGHLLIHAFAGSIFTLVNKNVLELDPGTCSSPPSGVLHKLHVFSFGKNSSDHVLLDSFSCGARMLAFFCAIFCITIFSSSSSGCSGMASV